MTVADLSRCALRHRRAAHAVPVREADRRPAGWLCEHGRVEQLPSRARCSPRATRPTCFYVLLERHGRAVAPGRRRRRRDQPDRAARRRTPGAWQAYLGDRVPQTYNELDAGRSSRRRFFVLDGRGLRRADARVVPDGGAPAGGPVLRQPEPPAGDRPAGAAARARLAVGRADPRAEQPGRGRGPGDRGAARAGRRDAAQAGADRRRARWDRASAGDADRAAGGGGRAGRRRRRRCPRWRPPTARTSSATGSTTTASPAAGTSRRRSSQAGLDVDWLDQVAAAVGRRRRSRAPCAGSTTRVETELLMNEIEDSTTRISDAGRRGQAVLAAGPRAVPGRRRARAARQHAGDAQRQDRHGIKVVKDYDRSLPQIPAYAAELNQVWTNLIDNAVAGDGRRRAR